MICLKTFKEVVLKDYKNLEEWKKFLIQQNEYCENNSKVWDWKEYLKEPSNLPSIHPYWNHVVWKEKQTRIKRILGQYKECYKDEELIKFYFGYSSLEEIRVKIKKEIKENKAYKQKIRY